MTKASLREWQKDALANWEGAGHRGIVEVVTGAGKTVFALACIDHLRPETTLVVVPTIALLEQWWGEIAKYFDLKIDEVNIITGKKQIRSGTINLAVLNTAAKLFQDGKGRASFLIVDECHKAASEQFRKILRVPKIASLGLSATPERPYDSGLTDVLIPGLGPVVFRYTYKDALRDGIIVPFVLRNVVFELEEDRKRDYEKLTKAIARSISKHGADAEETVALLLRRTRLINLSLNRIRLTIRIVAANINRRILIFHEDIEACNLMHEILAENGVRAGIYHSKLRVRQRVDMLHAYRNGAIDVLVTCRALDEGFDVPETEIGIIAASTATRRQRIQRLGRVLRPSKGKEGATIYSLVTTAPEIGRLKEEEERLEGVAEVSWGRA